MSRFAGRPRDLIWFSFLVMHIPTTLCIDLQLFYPQALLDATPFPAVLDFYIRTTRDPILVGVMGGAAEWQWLRTFFALEGTFQLASFVIGAWGLWKNDRRVYPLLVAYGASTATTLLPILYKLFTDTHTKPPLTGAEMGMLLSSYLPFLFVPLGMTVDMALRLVCIVAQADARKKE